MSDLELKGSGNIVSGRLKRLDDEGKTTNAHLFRVVNLLTDVETHVPGGCIGRFLNENYLVEYVGENKVGAVATEDPIAEAQAEAAKILADAQAEAAKIKTDAEKAAKGTTGKGAKNSAPEPVEAAQAEAANQ